MRLRISARKSDLARLQAYMVGEALQEKNPGLEVIYKFKESLGDINLTDPLWKIPEKGVFTEDFYRELIDGDTDMVVHSWKDLPTEGKPDTEIVATLPRADQRDLLLVKKTSLPRIQASKKLNLFSSSPRREYNLKGFLADHLPYQGLDVSFQSVRGNIPTRIRKLLETNEIDGLIVAKAALDRLLVAPQAEFTEVKALLRGYLAQVNWMVLPLSINPNAAAQGALAIEIASSRPDLKPVLAAIHDEDTFIAAQNERKILSSYGGGCHQKIGIAVLRKPYGEITFLRGLTDGGVVLKQNSLQKVEAVSTFPSEKMHTPETISDRKMLSFTGIPSGTGALLVARGEAWPDSLSFDGYVWAAGLKTWKNLAAKGIWVHGSSESLGEQEDPRINVLADKNLHWVKLTHEGGYGKDMPILATYTLVDGDFEKNFQDNFQDKEAFFWMSGTQFLKMAKAHPEILSKHHASGPGNTHQIIREFLVNNLKEKYSDEKVQVFLSQEDWRSQCTK
jgi:Porphobilinogen deaminase